MFEAFLQEPTHFDAWNWEDGRQKCPAFHNQLVFGICFFGFEFELSFFQIK